MTKPSPSKTGRTIFFTAFALTAFAFNSILCRLAFRDAGIDPVGFTVVRLVSGAIALILISFAITRSRSREDRGNWLSAFFLFSYAICFSVAYLGITAGTGALLLFGSVQMTMIGAALLAGERLHMSEAIGLAIALAGLVYLVLPGLASPPPANALLMIVAGVAWGIYTVRGKGMKNPLDVTSGNFTRAAVIMLLAALPFIADVRLTSYGTAMAVVSGAVTSAIGYTAWYAVVPLMRSSSAAVLQLAVPVLTAMGGVLLLSEVITLRLAASGILILGGILLTLLWRRQSAPMPSQTAL